MYEVVESQILTLSSDIDDLEEVSNEIVAAKDIAKQMEQKAEVCILIVTLQMETKLICLIKYYFIHNFC